MYELEFGEQQSKEKERAPRSSVPSRQERVLIQREELLQFEEVVLNIIEIMYAPLRRREVSVF
jgi:hypothetical protein